MEAGPARAVAGAPPGSHTGVGGGDTGDTIRTAAGALSGDFRFVTMTSRSRHIPLSPPGGRNLLWTCILPELL
jgi:hypothetical protein